MIGGVLENRTSALKLLLLVMPLWLAGCISAVDYGEIRHSDYVANGRCDPGPEAVTAGDKPFFFVTSRLPDCRTADLKLLNHRSNKVRFGRFAAPQDILNAKGKVDGQHIPFTLSNDARWWTDLSKAMDAREGRVLLYVHGFRETFFTSSRDTAQIARLTEFTGPVIQYSWPSQGQFLKYAVDETNMYYDERNFRQFLTKLAQQPWTKEIVLVSHSLGARLVLPAVEFVDNKASNGDSSVVSNIILASPDIDRQDFERGIAEEVLSARRVNNDRRITVYASTKDRALALSADIHGYPRLGRPRCFDPFKEAELEAKGLPKRCYAAKSEYDVPPEKSGLTIIDTTPVSRGRTGHSDYLRSAAACTDFAAVVNGARDNVKGRVPTHLSYVFTFIPPEDDKLNDKAICKQDGR
ncbi:alpha/beta hydrolase [Parasphingorhabdus sp. JC815]|uniref:alpha/beta hydrolase n=1 Tax=Parasphingorhabdus sp. JC815 TaxID=3232140 RepID=UPI003458301F